MQSHTIIPRTDIGKCVQYFVLGTSTAGSRAKQIRNIGRRYQKGDASIELAYCFIKTVQIARYCIALYMICIL